MSITRWDAKGRTHKASQGSFVRFSDHTAEIEERDSQVRDMEAIISMQRADVRRLSADLATALARVPDPDDLRLALHFAYDAGITLEPTFEVAYKRVHSTLSTTKEEP